MRDGDCGGGGGDLDKEKEREGEFLDFDAPSTG